MTADKRPRVVWQASARSVPRLQLILCDQHDDGYAYLGVVIGDSNCDPIVGADVLLPPRAAAIAHRLARRRR